MLTGSNLYLDLNKYWSQSQQVSTSILTSISIGLQLNLKKYWFLSWYQQVSTVTKSKPPSLIFFFVFWILKAKQSVKEENAETLFAGRKTKISRKVIFRYPTNSTIDKTNKIIHWKLLNVVAINVIVYLTYSTIDKSKIIHWNLLNGITIYGIAYPTTSTINKSKIILHLVPFNGILSFSKCNQINSDWLRPKLLSITYFI